MGKRIVIALGGNALGNNLPEQMIAVKQTSKAIADLIQEGHEVIISHGNGPQVGMIQKAMAALTASDSKYGAVPLSVCGAMSQGYIGYDLQNALREEVDRGIRKPVSTIITQVIVLTRAILRSSIRPNRSAISCPRRTPKRLVKEKGYTVVEDAGRGWRRVVASPKPQHIVEIETIRALMDAGQVVVAAGGGGIPVMETGGQSSQRRRRSHR